MDPRSSITVVRLKERQFLIPTEVLRRCCPALRRQLPSSNATITHLELSGIPEATFETLVYYFRTGRTPELNIQNVIDVYCTASDLGIRPLERKCWKHVFKTMSRQEQSLLLLVESERGIHMARDDTLRLMDVLVKHFRKTVNSAAFLQLSERQVRHLLTYPPLRDEHGINATYKAAMRWLHADCRARHGYVERLTTALGETPDATLTEKLSICPTIAREVSKVSQDSPSPRQRKSAFGTGAVEAKVEVKPEANLGAKPENPAEPVPEAPHKYKSNLQTGSSISRPRDKSPGWVEERPRGASSSQSARKTKRSTQSGKGAKSSRQPAEETSLQHDLGKSQSVKAHDKRVVGLVGGRIASQTDSNQQPFSVKHLEEHDTKGKTARTRTAHMQTHSKHNAQGRQRKSCDKRGDSSLTNAEREPSKRRRSVDEAKFKFKRDRAIKQRVPYMNKSKMHDDYNERKTSRSRKGPYQCVANAYESESHVYYPASCGDMVTPKSPARSKSRRSSDQSASLNQLERFHVTEANAKRLLRGGRSSRRRTRTGVVTKVSLENTPPSKKKIAPKNYRGKAIALEKKGRSAQSKTKTVPKSKAARKRTVRNVIIIEDSSETKGRKSGQRSTMPPKAPNPSEEASCPWTRKKSNRSAKVAEKVSRFKTTVRGRRPRREAATVTGKFNRKGKCVVC